VTVPGRVQLEARELETGRKKPDKPIFDVGA
jgi:hypothetical protein